MRRLIPLVLLVSLAACATVEGAGRDISKAGEMVSETARDVRRAF